MLSKRIIPCLDVRDGRTTKGIKFKDNVDIGDPVAMARLYYEAGADELVFYDITASSDRRDIMIEVVSAGGRGDPHPLFRGGRHPQPPGYAGRAPGRRGKGERQQRGHLGPRPHLPRARRPSAASASSWAWT